MFLHVALPPSSSPSSPTPIFFFGKGGLGSNWIAQNDVNGLLKACFVFCCVALSVYNGAASLTGGGGGGGGDLDPRLHQAHHGVGLHHPNGQVPSSGKRKRSWSRAVFSNLQRKGLEKRFQMQKYITKPDRRQLAATLGLTDAQVSSRLRFSFSSSVRPVITVLVSAAFHRSLTSCFERPRGVSAPPFRQKERACRRLEEEELCSDRLLIGIALLASSNGRPSFPRVAI